MLKKYLWSLPTCNLTKKWTFSQLFFKDFDQFSKQLLFSEHLLLTVYLLFINFYFCRDININFFLVSSFYFIFLLKRHYIGFFENVIVYSFMRSTSVNMFSANWENLLYFDKNGISFGGGSFPAQKDEEYPYTSHPKQIST